MKSTFKKLKGSKIALEVTVEPQDFQKYWDSAYERAVSNVSIKGFRPGAAPKELADNAINKALVMENAVNDAVRFTLNKITDENSWTMIDKPKVEVVSENSPLEKSGFKYTAELVLYPEITLPDYKKIAAKIREEKHEVAVTAEEISQSLEWLRKSRAPLVLVARPARKGDVVEVDFEADGKPATDKFELGEGKFIPGFEENIENKKGGDEFSFTIKAPNDYWKEEMRGKDIAFKVKLKSVFEMNAPEANDEFAKTLGKFENLEDLKKNINEGLKAEKENKEADRIKVKILEGICEGTKADLPEIFIEKTLDGLVEELRKTIEGAGKKAEDARGDLRKAAERRVLANIVIHEIAKQEHLEPSKEEVEEESKFHAGETKGLDVSRFYDYIYGILINKKVFELLQK